MRPVAVTDPRPLRAGATRRSPLRECVALRTEEATIVAIRGLRSSMQRTAAVPALARIVDVAVIAGGARPPASRLVPQLAGPSGARRLRLPRQPVERQAFDVVQGQRSLWVVSRACFPYIREQPAKCVRGGHGAAFVHLVTSSAMAVSAAASRVPETET